MVSELLLGIRILFAIFDTILSHFGLNQDMVGSFVGVEGLFEKFLHFRVERFSDGMTESVFVKGVILTRSIAEIVASKGRIRAIGLLMVSIEE